MIYKREFENGHQPDGFPTKAIGKGREWRFFLKEAISIEPMLEL